MSVEDPREDVRRMLEAEDFENLLLASAVLHGHFCPGLALGVRAGHAALSRLDFENTGMEELVAVVECNNCFADGVQFTTGCSFGNNALIYADLGKTAVTLLSRKLEKAVRVILRPGGWGEAPENERQREANDLFRRIVKERQVDPEGSKRMKQLWTELSFETVQKPEAELFEVRDAPFNLPAWAPIFDSATCSSCGEAFMETRARLSAGKPVCLDCAGEDVHAVLGSGIRTLPGGAFRS